MTRKAKKTKLEHIGEEGGKLYLYFATKESLVFCPLRFNKFIYSFKCSFSTGDMEMDGPNPDF